MGGNLQNNKVATAFAELSVPSIDYGKSTVTVSGKLVRTDTNDPPVKGTVLLVVKGHEAITAQAESDDRGKFSLGLDVSTLGTGQHTVEAKYVPSTDDMESVTKTAPLQIKVSSIEKLKEKILGHDKHEEAGETPAGQGDSGNDADQHSHDNGQQHSKGCNSPGALITAVNRVLRDPRVTAGVRDLLYDAAGEFATKGDASASPQDKKVASALSHIASAFGGTDAVRAQGESCRGQLRVLFFMEHPQTGKPEVLSPDLVRLIDAQLVDQSHNLASARRTYENDTIVFSDVEATSVFLALPTEISKGAEISDEFLATDPGGSSFKRYTRKKPQVTPMPSPAPQPHPAPVPPDQYAQDLKNAEEDISSAGLKLNEEQIKKLAALEAKRLTEARSQAADAGAEAEAKAEAAAAAAAAAGQPGQPKPPIYRPGIGVDIGGGSTTILHCFLRPPRAFVRVFSCVEGELNACSCASCAQGNQCAKSAACECTYVSKVAINAMRGERLVACHRTSDDGCAGFQLTPGWYYFSAPKDITIEGCNYTLASSTPTSAYVGAGQRCSDIVFCYRRKGAEILVDGSIAHPEDDNPQQTATENFPGVQYLLLRENDPTFAQQQVSQSGEAVRFCDLAAGTYWLFCQAPETFGTPPTLPTRPVRPVFPPDGRLTLSVFAGQVGAIPVYPRFQTNNVSSAEIDGYVRDDSGFPLSGQVVQLLRNGHAISAAQTDATGHYSIRVYVAEDLQLVSGSQTQPVSKTELQEKIKPVGPDAVPFANTTIRQAKLRTQLLGV